MRGIGVTLRAFAMDDMQKVLEIEEQAFPKTPYSRDALLGFANVPSNRFVVLEVEKDTVGYIMFRKDGHIISTAVKPVHRRKGYGRMLFAYAREHAGKRIWLEVRTKNQSAISFYEGMGMKIIGRTPNYYGDDDALIMALGER